MAGDRGGLRMDHALPPPAAFERPRPPATPRTAQRPAAEADQPAALQSQQLFRGQSVVHIQHNGATYLLRATKLGKLILTK